MFTVKVVRPNGNEDLYEARELTKEPRGILMQIGYTDTVFVGEGGAMLALDSLHDYRNSKHADPVNDSSAATVYVMNRFGATVATYSL